MNAATQANYSLLRERGVNFAGPASGSQACGETGPGRMLEPADIVNALAPACQTGCLEGVRVLIYGRTDL